MASVNKVILVGRLGGDPEMRTMPNGDAVCNITVATSDTWKDKATGEKKEQTEWHRVVLFRRQAEIASEYLSKGSMVYIEGSLKTRKWTDKEGIERYTTEIAANVLQLLSPKNENREERPRQQTNVERGPKAVPQALLYDDDSIPF